MGTHRGARVHPGRPKLSAALSPRGSAGRGGDTMGLRPDAERGSPESWTRPTKTRGGREVWRQVRGREAPSWGVGGDCVPELVPDSLQRGSPSPPGSSPEPVPDRPRSPPRIPSEPVPDPPRNPPGMPPLSPPRIPLELVPVPVRPARHRTSLSRVGSGTLGFTGSAARPSAGTHETRRWVPRSDPLPAAVPALCLAPGRRPRASAPASP